jgi:hypothetical protein
MKPAPLRRRLIFWATAVLAVVVAILIVLVAVGDLRITSNNSSPGNLTVSRVQWTIIQGMLNNTTGWFGPSHFNYTYYEGYPAQIAAGSTFGVALVVSNLGDQPHWMCSLLATPPFTFVSSHPTLPVLVPKGEDDAGFTFNIQTPSTPGAVLVLNLTAVAASQSAGCGTG